MDRRVTPPKGVTSPTWDPPPPCKQALSLTNFREEKYPISKISLHPYSLQGKKEKHTLLADSCPSLKITKETLFSFLLHWVTLNTL